MPTPPLNQSQLLASFPDNTDGEITAHNMRDFVQSVVLSVAGRTGVVTIGESDVAGLATDLASIASTIGGKLSLSGGTMAGDLAMGGNNLLGVANITGSTGTIGVGAGLNFGDVYQFNFNGGSIANLSSVSGAAGIITFADSGMTFHTDHLDFNNLPALNVGSLGLMTTTPPSAAPGTIIFDGSHFQGWNGSTWVQLDN